VTAGVKPKLLTECGSLGTFYVDKVDRPAPRKPRPEGRGQGELYKNGNLPYRVRKPAKRTPAREGGEASLKLGLKRDGHAFMRFISGNGGHQDMTFYLRSLLRPLVFLWTCPQCHFDITASKEAPGGTRRISTGG